MRYSSVAISSAELDALASECDSKSSSRAALADSFSVSDFESAARYSIESFIISS
jgi:hypothetical protein